MDLWVAQLYRPVNGHSQDALLTSDKRVVVDQLPPPLRVQTLARFYPQDNQIDVHPKGQYPNASVHRQPPSSFFFAQRLPPVLFLLKSCL
jgi:hypothetical protein